MFCSFYVLVLVSKTWQDLTLFVYNGKLTVPLKEAKRIRIILNILYKKNPSNLPYVQRYGDEQRSKWWKLLVSIQTTFGFSWKFIGNKLIYSLSESLISPCNICLIMYELNWLQYYPSGRDDVTTEELLEFYYIGGEKIGRYDFKLWDKIEHNWMNSTYQSSILLIKRS